MYGMSNNNINGGIGGAFVFHVIFKCLQFFTYQHTEMLVSQVNEFLLLKPLVIVMYTFIVWCSDIGCTRHISWCYVKLPVELFKCSHTPPQVGVMFLLLVMWNTDVGIYFITFGCSQSTIQTTEAGKEILLLIHCL